MDASDGKLTISAQTRLLVVAPHPDDETIATGLLLQQVRAAGGEVRILLLTAGDNNPWPQRWLERQWRIRAEDRQRWARRRGAELQEALSALGISPPGLQTLGWPDLGVTDLLMQSTGRALAVVGDAIDRFKPDLIALPALHDHHPDHSAAHVLLRLALAKRASPPMLLTYLVHGNADAGRFVEIDGSPAQLSNKHAAVDAHRSQTALSGKRLHRLADRPERYVASGSGLQPALDSLPWQPPRWLQPWLHLSVVDSAGAHEWAWTDAPLQCAADGRFQLSLRAGECPAPRFARLSLSLSSPWIFDHWGWCELKA
ncbi:MAG: PIG-L family deacetylase [Rhodanobacter sp.]